MARSYPMTLTRYILLTILVIYLCSLIGLTGWTLYYYNYTDDTKQMTVDNALSAVTGFVLMSTLAACGILAVALDSFAGTFVFAIIFTSGLGYSMSLDQNKYTIIGIVVNYLVAITAFQYAIYIHDHAVTKTWRPETKGSKKSTSKKDNNFNNYKKKESTEV